MSRKLKIVTGACVLLLGAVGVARASIPVASYTFKSSADVSAFSLIEGKGCSTKLVASKGMSVNVGGGTAECAYRTSVVADSTDTAPAQDVEATVAKGAGAAKKKAFVAVFVRGSENNAANGDYELRLIPATERWVLLRRGAGGSVLARGNAGAAKNAKKKGKKGKATGKADDLRLQVSGTSTAAGLIAFVNGKQVFTGNDSSAKPPSGRFNGIAVGKNGASVSGGARAIFTAVTVFVPF